MREDTDTHEHAHEIALTHTRALCEGNTHDVHLATKHASQH